MGTGGGTTSAPVVNVQEELDGNSTRADSQRQRPHQVLKGLARIILIIFSEESRLGGKSEGEKMREG